jgi:hypothetical protein
MSGKVIAFVTPSEVALTGASSKTVLQISTTAGTNLPRALLKKLAIMFDGTSTTAEPVIIRIVRQTTAGTATSLLGVGVNSFSDPIVTAGAFNFTVEPTAGDTIDVIEVHPQSGYSIIYPLGMEPVIPSNTRLAIVVTAPASVNCHASIWIEE